jgi:hypothetical protein
VTSHSDGDSAGNHMSVQVVAVKQKAFHNVTFHKYESQSAGNESFF